jgi:hypothetical protein
MALVQEPMKLIIECDAFCGPSLSNPGGAPGDDALAPQNCGGHAETFGSPAEYRLQDGINIDRGVGVHLSVRQTCGTQCFESWRFVLIGS